MFPKIMVPQNGWFIMENPIKSHGLGVPLFLETPILPSGGLYATDPTFYWGTSIPTIDLAFKTLSCLVKPGIHCLSRAPRAAVV